VGQAERVSAGWVASNPDTPGGPATYTYGSGLLNATDNTGTAYYTRDPGGTLISQRLPGGVVYHYLLDGQGSVVRLVDPSGNVVATYHYCPTGNAAVPPSGPAAPGNHYQQGGNFYEPGTQTYVLPNGTRVDANSGNATQGPATQFAALIGPGGGSPTLEQRLLRVLRVAAARAQNGFDPLATPLIVDESASINIWGLTPALQFAGYNALSVRELFGRTKVTDPEILNLARQVQGRVVTYDQGKDVGGGFAETALLLNFRRPYTIFSAVRQVVEQIGPP
jgi:hypothetical protein